MKRTIRALAFLLSMSSLVLAAPSRGADDVGKPLAVWFYADWCTNCRLIAPKYESARAGLDDRIRFVKLDLTDDDTKAKARAMAVALGISPLYYSNHATGWVALLDGKHEKVGELHSDLSVEDMRAALGKLARGE